MMRSFIFGAMVGVVLGAPIFLYAPGGGIVVLQNRSVPEPESSRASILFVGDLMYDRTVRREADARGDDFIFSCIARELHSHDIVVANLETPITSHASVSLGSDIGSPNNYRFTSPERVADVLRQNNIRLVSIGNNHINDFGAEGVRETRTALDAAGIRYAGDPRDPENIAVELTVNDIPITLVAYNEFYGFTVAETLMRIEEGDSEGFVIVVAHWGEEYETEASERQREWARQFVDAGADLVVGTHPHVIQESELYDGVPIYYSLGNFLFDQYMNEDVTTGLALAVTIGEDGVESSEERIVRIGRDRRPCIQAR